MALPSPEKRCGLSPSPALFFCGVKISLLWPIVVLSSTFSEGVCADICGRQGFPDPGDLMSGKIRQDRGPGGTGVRACVSLITWAARAGWGRGYFGCSSGGSLAPGPVVLAVR